MNKLATFVAMGVLLVAAATYMPIATAHECQAEAGTTGEASCSAPCTKGEEHHHIITHHHENGWGEDENHIHYDCTSHKEDKEPTTKKCTTPRILGFCIISEDGESDALSCIEEYPVRTRAAPDVAATMILEGCA